MGGTPTETLGGSVAARLEGSDINTAEKPTDDAPIVFVTPEHLNQVLERIVPLLETVVKPDTGYTVDAVIYDLIMGETLLWIIGDFQALTITRIVDKPAERVLWNEWLAGKDMESWVSEWLDVQEQYAKNAGCTAIEFNGRRGYMKKYSPLFPKFKGMRTLYRCEL